MLIMQVIVMYTQVETRGSCINSSPAFVELHLWQCARCRLGGMKKTCGYKHFTQK